MTKTKQMRRKIPILRISVEQGANYSQLANIPEVRKAVLEETLYAIKEGIEKNKKSISLFELALSDCYIELDKQNWKVTLEKALETYVEKEDYNKCIEIRDLINKL